MSRAGKSAALVALGLAVFSAARFLLWWLYPESFASLNSEQTLGAFLSGMRFDASVLLGGLALPLAAMNLPFAAARKAWFDACAWLGFAVVALLALVVAGDIAYFGEVERHLADELRLLRNDSGFVFEQSLSTYRLPLAALVLALAGLALGWRRLLVSPLAQERGKGVVRFLVVVLVLVVGTRGTLDSKPLGLIDAYRGGATAFGNLSLNGPFTAVHSWRGADASTDYDFVPEGAAYDALGLDATPYPLQQSIEGAVPTGRNVVVLLLESWDPRYLGSYSGELAQTEPPITPNFDALAAAGLRFDACYAGSQRSVDAIQALLTGVPVIAGEPSLGWGLRLARITELGAIAARRGYETLFVQSSKRRSYRLDSAARSLGFEHVYGQEDVAAREGATPGTPKWGWDHDTLRFALDQMNGFSAPFLAFVFTGSTHVPYADPGARFQLRPHAESGEEAFVNMLHYSDWALGEFMRAARTEPWFANTVFLLTADHTFRAALGSDDMRENYRVPFLLYAPGTIEAGVDSQICSHLDGMPTILELLGFSDAFSTFGQSLLRERDAVALVMQGNVMGIVSANGYLTHSLESRLAVSPPPTEPAELDRLERRLLSTVQLTHRLLRANRWAPAEPRP